jgi:hypothetical protein
MANRTNLGFVVGAFGFVHGTPRRVNKEARRCCLVRLLDMREVAQQMTRNLPACDPQLM